MRAHPLLTALGEDEDDAALAPAARAAHPLHQPHRALLGVEADDEIHLPDVQTFLPDAGGHQGVIPALTEAFHHLSKGFKPELQVSQKAPTAHLAAFPGSDRR